MPVIDDGRIEGDNVYTYACFTEIKPRRLTKPQSTRGYGPGMGWDTEVKEQTELDESIRRRFTLERNGRVVV